MAAYDIVDVSLPDGYDECNIGAANSRLEQILPKLAESAGATETLKANDPLRWAGLMNTCKAQAEETILAELIYA